MITLAIVTDDRVIALTVGAFGLIGACLIALGRWAVKKLLEEHQASRVMMSKHLEEFNKFANQTTRRQALSAQAAAYAKAEQEEIKKKLTPAF